MKKKTTLIATAAVLTVFIAGMMLIGASAASTGDGAVAPTQTLAANTATDVIDAPIASFGYPVVTVEAGKQVTINFRADASILNGCNDEIVIPAFGIDQRLAVGDNLVTFTPTEVGQYPYTCWMGMIQSTINVVEPGSVDVGSVAADTSAGTFGGCIMAFGNGGAAFSGGGCCGN